MIESKWRLNVSNLHLCEADYYHNSFDGYRGNVLGWSEGIHIPVGGSIKVLIRTQGE